MVYALAVEVKVNELTAYVNELLRNQDLLKTEEGAFLTENDPMVSIIAREMRFRGDKIDKERLKILRIYENNSLTPTLSEGLRKIKNVLQ